MIDRLQRGAERLAQLQANAAEAATALQAARDSLATLEKTKEVEALRLEKVTTDTRLMMIRKTLVRTSLCGEA